VLRLCGVDLSERKEKAHSKENPLVPSILEILQHALSDRKRLVIEYQPEVSRTGFAQVLAKGLKCHLKDTCSNCSWIQQKTHKINLLEGCEL